MSSDKETKPVFFDQSGVRRYAVSAVSWGMLTIIGIVITSLVIAVFTNPNSPLVKLDGKHRSLFPLSTSVAERQEEPEFAPRHKEAMPVMADERTKRYAHLVAWDDNSFSSLKANAQKLDVVIAEWLFAGGPDHAVTPTAPEKEALVRQWLSTHAPEVKVHPLVSNFVFATNSWDGDSARAMLRSPELRQNFVQQLRDYLVHGDYPGVVLDIEQFTALERDHYSALVREVAEQLHPIGKTVSVQAAINEPIYDLKAIGAAADAVIISVYDEHTEDAVPGPIAGQGWFEREIEAALAQLPAEKIIFGVGSYGYDWSAAGRGQEISVQEALELMVEAKAELKFDTKSLNPTFSYTDDEDHDNHEVWYLDGATMFNQVATVLGKRPAGIALWRLGTEDPGVWSTFGRGRTADAAAFESLKAIGTGYDVLYVGKGEVLEVSGVPAPGSRELAMDASGSLIVDQKILTFPQSTVVHRWGARDEKMIALTFDDGPDGKYTPQILDILAEKDVKASFFVVGSSAVLHSDILRRIYNDGHDIGNHTFTHANTAEASSEHIRVELNATQRLLESTLGIQTKLFRPPYAEDFEPRTVDAAVALRVSGELGYLSIGMNIDPKDWYQPIAKQIVAKTLAGARQGLGNVVLLHDAGGARTATIQALPEIIDTLRAEGFRFVTVHELLGLDRSIAMPAVAPDYQLTSTINLAGFSGIRLLNGLCTFLFYLGLALGITRSVVVCALAVVQKRREVARAGIAWQPPSVTAIVPAFNESKVVCKSIQSLLASPVRNLTVLVVDDGSTDDTAEVVRRNFGNEPRVKLITKPNGGKWSALNLALSSTQDDIVVTLDADTLFEPDAIGLLIRHFDDAQIAAVAGHAMIGNRVNFLTRFQTLEYVTNQNLDRRALEVVNGITVVPGAIGAWRRQALLDIGGFQADTLAEDADATVRLGVAGWKIIYEPNAIAHTEAPETVRAFMKQRRRWMFGTLQVAIKNWAAMFQRKPSGVGAFGLPNILVFQFFFTLAAPIIDLMLVWSLISAVFQWDMRASEGMPLALQSVLIYWLFFQLVEIASAALATSLDARMRIWNLLPLLLLQRFCYRQLLYITACRVTFAACKGTLQGWGKLARTGHAQMASASSQASPQT